MRMLKNKVSLITGCNRGIGKAILELYAQNGSKIYAHSRKKNEDFVEFLNHLSEKYDVEIIPVFWDLTDYNEMKIFFRKLVKSKEYIDVLVNNAGVTYNSLFLMSSIVELRKQFEVNFFALYQLTQYIVKLMTKAKKGSIINVSSTAAFDGNMGKSAYGPSKAAVHALTQTLSAELGAYNIRVNSVAPGVTDTDMLKSMPENIVLETIEQTDIKRLGKPIDIANTVLFLGSDYSSYISGQVIRVDGGLK
ncbi:SDR family NAD(P)-dependent oxidoreductase [Candidatus Izemoplasma sp. B36]|uniref:SDR family NAD(P)-dependent oxidoreductase n=1 Tax=Candidatus Izemoplasma sp. B36 TaxID=3242468 RepID=UPI003557F0DE